MLLMVAFGWLIAADCLWVWIFACFVGFVIVFADVVAGWNSCCIMARLVWGGLFCLVWVVV